MGSMIRCTAAGAMAIFALLPAMVLAAAESGDHPGASPPALMLMQTLAGLLVVIALILGLAWLAKKFNVSAMGQGSDLRVLSSISLGTREKAVLIEVRGEQLLLGVAPGRVSALHRLPQVATESQPAGDVNDAEAQPTNPLSSEFASKLNQILKFGHRV